MTFDAITNAFAEAAAAVVTLAPGRWALTLPGATPDAVVARADDHWLLLETLAEDAPAPELLAFNATTTGGARAVLGPAPVLRADVPLDDPTALAQRVAEACAGLAGPTGVVPAPVPDDALAARCRETAWPVVERDGVAWVGLDVPGDVQRAAVARRDDASVLVGLDVVEAPASNLARDAVATLLLRTTGAVRMVRATSPARFEVVFTTMPSADALSHAFAALSVACRLAAREATVLDQDESVARAYVAHIKGGDRCRPR